MNTWPNRATLNLDVIHRQDPDLIAFQELERHSHLATYAAELADYDHFLGPVYGTADLQCYVPIFWKRQRMELVDAGGFWLSPTPAVQTLGWDAACTRSAAWVRLKDLKSGLEFLHLNTHLDHIGAQAKIEGARLIAARLHDLAGGSAAVLLTGDFNDKAGSPPYDIFQGAGFTDTFVAAGNSDAETFTYHGFKGTDPDKSWRIDWILVRGLPRHASIARCAIIRDAAPPIYPSDHFPVMAELAFV